MIIELNERILHVFNVVARVLGRDRVRLVGGSVRDMLMGIEPKDLDFAIVDDPETAARKFIDRNFKVIATGISHGTITVIINKESVELTTLRRDVETDGRHATVEYTDSFEEDASRRDFTFNAMYLDIDGNLYDHFNGLQDLKDRVVRFVGDPRKRIQEDYLRILRFYRFSSMLDDPAIDPNVGAIIGSESVNLDLISGERIWNELLKILTGRSRLRILNWMNNRDVLFNISPVLDIDQVKYAKLEQLDSDPLVRSPLYFLTAMIDDVHDLVKLKARLKFDNNSFSIMNFIVNVLHDREMRDLLVSERKSDITSRVAVGSLDPALLVHYSTFIGDRKLHAIADELASKPIPKFPVSGNDLIELGIPPGKDVGLKLSELRNLWGKSGFSLTRDELLSKIGETCI